MRVTDKKVYFWGEFLSNWHPCHIVVNDGDKDLEFFNSEQYFMYMKAVVFGDEAIAMRILREGKNPKVAKSLGRMVKGYNDKVWNQVRYQIMLNANMYKYLQDKELQKMLLNPEFDGKSFCEASPVDQVWGVGLGENDPLIDDENNWRGKNLLGKVLDEVRNNLKNIKEN